MCTHRASRILVYSIPLPYMARLNGPFGLHRVKFLKEATTHSTQHANWATYTMRINGIYDCKYECEYANVNVSMRIWIWMQYSLLIQSLWLSMQSLVINLQLADSNGGFPPSLLFPLSIWFMALSSCLSSCLGQWNSRKLLTDKLMENHFPIRKTLQLFYIVSLIVPYKVFNYPL